jgi:UDP-glucose:(heptosyl)LPS alpha-1,3-glucosyltransferase
MLPDESLKIALVILHADPARGGAERYTLDLAHALAERGHDVSLLASSFAEVRDPVVQVPLMATGTTRLGRYLRFLDSLDAHLADTKYDVVHAMLPVRRCDVYHPHAGLAAESIASGHLKHAGSVSRGLSRWANAMNRKRQRFAAVERELLTGSRPPVALCLSEYVKRTLRQHYDLPADRLATLFNAVDVNRYDPRRDAGESALDLRKRLNVPHVAIVALMIAQDFQRKGLAEAIGALAQLEDRRLVLVVVGKQEPGSYRRLARRLGVEARVIFNGPTKSPFDFYRAADFFVLPTRHDPCSLVVLEALAMGLPVISTVFNGACEIIENGRHGFVLTDPGDVPALAGMMHQLLDPATRQAMSQACLALRPRLAYEHHLDELLRTYEVVTSTPAVASQTPPAAGSAPA